MGILPVVLQADVMRVASAHFRPLAGSILITALNLGLGAGLGSLVSWCDRLQLLPFIASAIAFLAIVPLLFLRLRTTGQTPSNPETTLTQPRQVEAASNLIKGVGRQQQ